MRFLIVVICALAAANASPCTETDVGDNPIDNLVKEAFEYLRKLMQEEEPFSVGNIPTLQIQDTNPQVDLTVTTSNILVSNASDFKVNYINNNLVGLWAKFGVSEPQAHATGDYVINGTAVNKAVSGIGNFLLDVSNINVDGFVQIEIVNHSVQMKSMQFNYTIDNLKFQIQGLEVEGMTTQQLNDLFSTKLLAFFQQDEAIVSQKIARFVIEQANKICAGKTIEQLLQWLKNWIHQ